MTITLHATGKPSGATHSLYIFSDISQLSTLNFSPEELSWLADELPNQEIISLPRAPRVLHLAYAQKSEQSEYHFREKLRLLGNRLAAVLKSYRCESLDLSCPTEPILALSLAEGLVLGSYRFDKYRRDRQAANNRPLQKLYLLECPENEVAHTQALLEGTLLARDLVNEPLSFLTATQLAREAEKAGERFGFKTEILNKKKIESLKMGGLLAVNRGSVDPPSFSIMEYRPKNAVNKKPIVLVGKGVVYDTGGLSLKSTAGSMDTMKCDMAGAAAVIGTMSAVAAAALPLHLVALVPATDNRPGGNAYVPGDIITMYDGTSVEVLNTDAEGRLLLADALAYAQKYQPQMVFDLATLTGAAAVAIGKYGVPCMGTAPNAEFDRLEKAGQEAYERTARLPFWDEYKELLETPIADMKNIGGREAGAITAGKFLEHFTDYPWIHLDIAGPAYLDKAHHYRSQGGTGVGVRLLFHYLKSLT